MTCCKEFLPALAAAFCCAFAHAGWAGEPMSSPPSFNSGVDAVPSLVKEYESARKAKEQAALIVISADAQLKARDELRAISNAYAARFFDYARRYPQQAEALDALVWVVDQAEGPIVDQSVQLILRDHVNRLELAPVLGQLADSNNPNPSLDQLYRGAIQQSERREVRGNACFSFARRLLNTAQRQTAPPPLAIDRSHFAPPLPASAPAFLAGPNPSPAPGYSYASSGFGPSPRLLQEADHLIQRVVTEFSDVPYADPRSVYAAAYAPYSASASHAPLTAANAETSGGQAKLGEEAKKVWPKLTFASNSRSLSLSHVSAPPSLGQPSNGNGRPAIPPNAQPRSTPPTQTATAPRSTANASLPILHKTGPHSPDDLGPGKIAPEIIGVDLANRPMRLSQFRGRVTLLTFWATWCPSCVATIPYERDLVVRFQGKPFSIVGVSGDKNAQTAQAHLNAERVNWPNFFEGSNQGPIVEAWGLAFWPTTYIIDHRGVIRYKNLPVQQMERAITALLAERDSALQATQVAVKKPN